MKKEEWSHNNSFLILVIVLIFNQVLFAGDPPGDESKEEEKKSHKLNHIKTIVGKISPKSIVHNGDGKFFAQNMMYRHTITVYNRRYSLLKTIEDEVKLADYGHDDYQGTYKGAPVECAFSHGGKYAWVSNYEMKGGSNNEFTKPGCDGCIGSKYDQSYVYKINTDNYELEEVIEVGSVPKYIATTPDDKYVLVSNWTSSDLSIISSDQSKEIKRINLGALPRGISVNSKSTYAYVAIMGSNKVAKINLFNFKVSWIKDVGSGPRHTCISPDDQYLYVSLNNEGKVVRIDLDTYAQKEVKTGSNPRSMVLSQDGRFLYIVNYASNTLSKVETSTMEVVHECRTNSKPIGITFDEETKNVWVACYTGRIMIFHDTYYDDGQYYVLADKEKDNDLKFLSYSYISRGSEEEEEKEPLLSLREIAEITAQAGEDRSVAIVKEPKPKKKIIAAIPKKTESKPKEVSKTPTLKSVVKETVKETLTKETTKGVSGYLVVSGAFKDEGNAMRRLDLMKKRGYDAGIYYSSAKDLNMVYVGKFKTKNEAIDFTQLNKIDAWIYQAK